MYKMIMRTFTEFILSQIDTITHGVNTFTFRLLHQTHFNVKKSCTPGINTIPPSVKIISILSFLSFHIDFFFFFFVRSNSAFSESIPLFTNRQFLNQSPLLQSDSSFFSLMLYSQCLLFQSVSYFLSNISHLFCLGFLRGRS